MNMTAAGEKWGNTFSPSPPLEVHEVLLVDEVPELKPLEHLAF